MSSSQFTCQICGQGYEQKSRLERHILTSHPEPAPSAANVEKVLSGIKFPKSKDEILSYTSSKQETKVNEDLLDLIQNLPERIYRDSAEVAIALGESKSGKKVRSAEEVENTEPASKKGGKRAVMSVSASTLAKSLSGIDLPQSKENINKSISRNIANMDKESQSKILKIFENLPKKDYKDMAEIEKELGRIL